MRLLYRRCAGLDIHKKSISACILIRQQGQPEPQIHEEVFGTFTQDLERLAAWLKQHRVKQVAMESTGVYWIPAWNILEQPRYGFALTLVNPAIVRALQGHKTDRIDARRIAEFLQYGLLRGSFIPPLPVRQMRELTRMRVHIQQDRNRVINRIGRLLETANIKLGSVASNIVGKSGRAMLDLLANGMCDAARLADQALGRLRDKLPELALALEGRTDAHFRWMLRQQLNKLDGLDQELAALDLRLDSETSAQNETVARLCTIPGIDVLSARAVLAELGTDMTPFPTAKHVASWAGLCPGNAESAGKRFSGRTRKGDRYLRRILVQCAWAASRTRNSFFAGLFHRIALRRGIKKATVAVAHRLLTIIYILLREGDVYREHGSDYFDQLNPERTARKLTKRLERIGYAGALVRKQTGCSIELVREPADDRPIIGADVCARCHRLKRTECFHLIKRPARPENLKPSTPAT